VTLRVHSVIPGRPKAEPGMTPIGFISDLTLSSVQRTATGRVVAAVDDGVDVAAADADVFQEIVRHRLQGATAVAFLDRAENRADQPPDRPGGGVSTSGVVQTPASNAT
jgi:hypothetical protein